MLSKYVSHSFIILIIQICKIWVWKFWYMSLLCMLWLLLDYLNEIKCVMYAIFFKLTLMFSWKYLDYSSSTPIFLSNMIDYFGILVLIWIACFLPLDLITFAFFSIIDLLINCHVYLNLVSKDLFLRLKGVLHF